jgi:hypothetical protein
MREHKTNGEVDVRRALTGRGDDALTGSDTAVSFLVSIHTLKREKASPYSLSSGGRVIYSSIYILIIIICLCKEGKGEKKRTLKNLGEC